MSCVGPERGGREHTSAGPSEIHPGPVASSGRLDSGATALTAQDPAESRGPSGAADARARGPATAEGQESRGPGQLPEGTLWAEPPPHPPLRASQALADAARPGRAPDTALKSVDCPAGVAGFGPLESVDSSLSVASLPRPNRWPLPHSPAPDGHPFFQGARIRTPGLLAPGENESPVDTPDISLCLFGSWASLQSTHARASHFHKHCIRA